MEDLIATSMPPSSPASASESNVHATERAPVLMLERDVLANPEFGRWAQSLFDTFKNEGSASRGIAHIAPNLFIGSERRGYFHYSRHRKIVLVYAYTGPEDSFEATAGELLAHCERKGYQLNFLSHRAIASVADSAFSATPFGVVQRVDNLPEFSLRGTAMQRLRYQVSAFKKTGECTVDEYRCGTDPAIDEDIARVIDSWCAGKTMVNPLVRSARQEILAGTLHPRHRLFLTRTNGVLQNVVLISPLNEVDNGYLMDLEFYGADMPRGGLEFAIVSIIEILVAEGRTLLSLGGTYGCRIEQSQNADPGVDALLDDLHKQNIFNDQGNFQFKNKFRPQAQTIYLCRKADSGNPDSVIDIIMMIADPSRAQTSDAENHTGFPTLESAPALSGGGIPADKMLPALPPTDISPGEGEKKKGIEPLGESAVSPSLSDGPRSRILADAHFNPLQVQSENVEFDLKTDSWAQLSMPVIAKRMKELHGRLQQPIEVDAILRDLFPFTHFLHTESGRAAEQALYRAWPRKGVVLQNVLFPTNLVHQIDNDFKPKELPADGFFRVESDEPGKSELALESLAAAVAENPQAITMVYVELSDNAAGGHPISTSHLSDIKALLATNAIPLVIDATRVLENAMFLLEREPEHAGKDLWSVARQLLSFADAVVASLPKDFGIHKGGLFATSNPVLFRAACAAVDKAGTGLDVFDRKLVALALRDRRYLERRVAERMAAVRTIWFALKQGNVPILQPAGGHCVLIDVKRISVFAKFENPVASFVAWLYLNTGIRAAGHNVGMQRRHETSNLVRLAIPLGLSKLQVDEIARRLVALFDRMANIPEIVLAKEARGSFGEMTTKYSIKHLHNPVGDAQEPLNEESVSIVQSSLQPDLSVEQQAQNPVDADESYAAADPDQAEHGSGNDAAQRLESGVEKSAVRRIFDIAVVGMAGRYPKAKNIDELWQNLKQGRDCIEDLPIERYEQRLRYGPAAKYRGGFIDDIDKFDSLFFNIPPKDAERLDPQERLFVEVAWETLEDAGYSPERISRGAGSKGVGVYVGAVWAMYQTLGVEEKHHGGSQAPNSFLWSIANRVSYSMNLSGPSLTIDTACSSSLTALYLACEAIYAGECDSALVGGVNLDLHQSKWDINSSGGALSKDGVCRSFGDGANGYVAGEGIGAVYIKPLDQAIADGDQIYGVIKSVVVNHGGRTSGFVVPNPKAQTNLIRAALRRANVDASSIGYIEAHGTGTELGDPLEIAALNNAFRDQSVPKHSCAVGSLKSNIGHLEAAAGVVSLSKVLLQMQHRQLVPSLHSAVLNEHIDFESSPFHVQQQLEEWKPKEVDGVRLPLRAGISSFGAGGSNAHVILEAYEVPAVGEVPVADREMHIIPLSARNEAQLTDVAMRLLKHIESSESGLALRDIAFTLQMGRKAFEYRVAIVVRSKQELFERLKSFISGKKRDGVIVGNVKNADPIVKLMSRGEREEVIALLSRRRDPVKIAKLWSEGMLLDWQGVNCATAGKRVSLPGYPFADKRHWIPLVSPASGGVQTAQRGIHPLVDSNESTFEQQLFRKVFHDRDFFIYDHFVMDVPTLPGVAYLELARKAGELAAGRPVRRLHNVVWVSPIAVRDTATVEAWVELKPANGVVRFEVYSNDQNSRKILHSQGRLSYATESEAASASEYLDLAGIRARCAKVMDGRDAYPLFKSFGLNLGPSFQSLQEVYRGDTETLGLLKLPSSRLDDLQSMLLHPSLVDGALQAGVAAQLGSASGDMLVPFSIGEVEVLHPLTPVCWTYVTEMIAERVENSRVSRKNVTIVDEDGRILVRIKEATGVPITEVNKAPAGGKDAAGFAKLYYAPQWEPALLSDTESAVQVEETDALLLFDTDGALRDLYRQSSGTTSTGRRVVLVRPAAKYSEIDPETYEIDPGSADQFAQLIESLSARKHAFREVCFAWSMRQATPVQDDETLQNALSNSVYAVLNLCQSLVKLKLDSKLQLVFVYARNGDDNSLYNEAISGFFRSLHLEFPKIRCKALEVRQDTWQLEPVLAAIRAEFRDLVSDAVAVRYLEGERQVRRLKSFDLKHQDGTPGSSYAPREGGVYLITGGAGGLGLIFARYLASTYKARLLLTGRSRLTAEREAQLAEMRDAGAEVAYVEADVSSRTDVQRLIEEGKRLYGEINGVIHSAGVLRDSYLRNKSRTDFEAVLAPKVFGTLYLDEFTVDEPLDFFVLFSSMASVGGNAGQSDYAYANHFMDSFAHQREQRRSAGTRCGKTLSLNWSLWADGGMRVDEQTEQFFTKTLGLKLLATDTGIEAFVEGLASDATQLAVIEGIQDKIEIAWGLRKKPAPPVSISPAASSLSSGSTTQQDAAALVQAELTRIAMDFLKLDAADISPDSVLLDLGFDSIGLTTYANEINSTYGVDVTPVLFFDYPSIQEVAKYLASERADDVARVHATSASGASAATAPAPAGLGTFDNGPPMLINKGWDPRAFDMPVERANHRVGPANRFADMPIAIVGMSGVMPQSDDLDEFWDNLKNGRDLITVIPKDRWDWEEFYGDPFKEANKSNSKWGGFMKEVDKFDALFFGISKREAQMMDPQQRIFLETVWKAIEDSGHRVSDLSGTRTGLFVGVATNDYVDVMNRMNIDLDGYSASGNSHSVLANRVSFLLNLRGPSAPIDTACSSSLVALHRAIESIHSGSSDMAIVGGVQVMLSPAAYISFGMAGMLSNDGKCKTFDKRADGYVRGEGSGAILLKPLSKAEADGDHIYAVIRATSENHGGRVTTLTAPNSAAQAELLIDAYEKAQIDPGNVGYIECHGTGTGIGDPIEIQGLTKAFSELYKKHDRKPSTQPHCGLSSAKTNIGHLETAAGIAGILRALLAIKHRQIPANVHFEEINPYIKIDTTPFYIVDRTRDWEAPVSADGKTLPRCAGVSSFGFGGANAHIVLEEYVPARAASNNENSGPQLIVLSAKTDDRLRAYAESMLVRLGAEPIGLLDFAYTLQVGRDEMSERLAMVVSSVDELCGKLRRFIDGVVVPGTCRGSVRPGKKDAPLPASNSDSVQALTDSRDFQRLAELWVSGVDIDWALMPRAHAPRRLAVPTYPFARERCWIPGVDNSRKNDRAVSAAPAAMAAPAPASPPVIRQVTPPPSLPRTAFYRSIWEEMPVASSAPLQTPLGTLLLFARSEDAREVIQRRLSARSEPVPTIVLVRPGSGYRKCDHNSYEINPTQRDDYAALFAALQLQSSAPAHIVHAWSGLDRVSDDNALKSGMGNGIGSLLYLTQTLVETTRKDRTDRANTQSAKSVGASIVYLYPSERDNPQPHHAAAASFARSAVLEAPQLKYACIEFVDSACGDSLTEDAADRLIEALGNGAQDCTEIRCEAGRRLVKTLQPYSPAAATAIVGREQGTYVITGGAGGLGLIFAKHMASHSQVRLALIGRSALDAEQMQKIEELKSLGAQVAYLRGDIADRDDAFRLLQETRDRFGSIHGIIHAAGVIRDTPIERKTFADFEASSAPKIHGTMHLDEASQSDDLDFFVLFSSLAAVLGSSGQCDYAYANGFQDHFVELRERLVTRQLRRGRTFAFDWPMWEHGGMQVERIKGIQLDEKTKAYLQESSGIHPLDTPTGLSAFATGLLSGERQLLVMHGNQTKIEKLLGIAGPETSAAVVAPNAPRIAASTQARDTDHELAGLLKRDLLRMVSETLLVDASQVVPDVNLSEYGLDSIGVANLFRMVNGHYALNVAPAVVFEYPTFEAFSGFLLAMHSAELRMHYADALVDAGGSPVAASVSPTAEVVRNGSDHGQMAAVPSAVRESVAIVGMSGVFPGAGTPDEFWRSILAANDLVSEIPADRWDWRAYQGDSKDARNTTNARWGGFIRDVEMFDATFFGIGALEAALMDPQQRLFLQTAWNAIEDSGHRPSELSGTKTGVFVGLGGFDYVELLRNANADIMGYSATGMAHCVLPNRLSYLLDLRGPSEAIDTACSSSLVALHHAVEAIAGGTCTMAIAGGVNLLLTPSLQIALGSAGMLAGDGRCKTFDHRADGYVRGEGCAAIFLKRLDMAIADGDTIHGVIKGSAVNHGGRAMSLTAPNPNAQADLLIDVYERSNVDPASVGLIEAHGTGTALGDAVELNGLKKAFRELSTRSGSSSSRSRCAVSSVKTNIGHLEAASGIASMIKVLLSIRHRKIPGVLHFQQLNPQIRLDDSPFYIAQQSQDWDAFKGHDGVDLPLTAGISSLGFGGVNAHVIVQEHLPDRSPARPSSEHASKLARLILLSAKTQEQLLQRAQDLLSHLVAADVVENHDLAGIAFTLQAGRESMENRLGLLVDSIADLVTKLQAFVDAEKVTGNTYRSEVGRDSESVALINRDADIKSTIVRKWLSSNDLGPLLELWTKGVDIDWPALYGDASPRRSNLPVYPFARERHWVDTVEAAVASAKREQLIDGRVAVKPLVAGAGPSRVRSAAGMAEHIIKAELAQQLEAPAETLAIDRNFLDLGVSSLGIASLVREVNRRLALDLSPSIIFEYPTIAQFAAYLVETDAASLGRAMADDVSGADTHATLRMSETSASADPERASEAQSTDSVVALDRILEGAALQQSEKEMLDSIVWKNTATDEEYERLTF